MVPKQRHFQSSLKLCAHCQLEVVVPSYLTVADDNDQSKEIVFCCNGCRAVYQILHQEGMERYYQLKEAGGGQAYVSADNYLFLDSEQFLEQSAPLNNQGERELSFYLQGVHCVACLWLIEQLPKVDNGVVLSQLNMGQGVVRVRISRDGLFSKVATTLDRWGYRPFVLSSEGQLEKLQKREDRQDLIRVGLAAGCAANIMLFAIAIYGGAGGDLGRYFEWLSLLLSIPVLTYSAAPFYRSAWGSLQSGTISIDLPIAIALVVGWISGLWQLLSGGHHIYFDSLTILVFLLLTSRLLLKRAQQRGMKLSLFNTLFGGGHIRKEGPNGAVEEVLPSSLLIGDVMLVAAGEQFAADGVIIDGSTLINNSMLSGESCPVKVGKGEMVYSAALNLDSEIKVKVTASGEQTRVGQVLQEIEQGLNQRAPITKAVDRLAHYFLLVLFSLATLTFIFFLWRDDLATALLRSVTLIIVSCPCALGLATPLALTRTISKLAAEGIIVRREEVLERTSQIQEIFLDKTGTITYGVMQVVGWEESVPSTQMQEYYAAVYMVAKRSNHPVSQAITSYLEEHYHQWLDGRLMVEEFSEQPGEGSQGRVGEYQLAIGRIDALSGAALSRSGVSIDGKMIVEIGLTDQLRPDSTKIVSQLRQLDLKIRLLTGDNREVASTIGQRVGLTENEIYSEVGPERKGEIVEGSGAGLMVGDGANDALALTKASVGVAVKGSVEMGMNVCDLYFTRDGIRPLYRLIVAAQETMRIIYRNLAISILYNLVVVVLTLQGVLNPLLAAILMPISSLTVLLSTIWGTGKLRREIF
ncbi:MAG: heavy metal translocating P-type ATPase [Bdellovibrionales bacterium]|nr:heavy metal translocating P-type ATPase [Bdellovibrionales bacterium]